MTSHSEVIRQNYQDARAFALATKELVLHLVRHEISYVENPFYPLERIAQIIPVSIAFFVHSTI